MHNNKFRTWSVSLFYRICSQYFKKRRGCTNNTKTYTSKPETHAQSRRLKYKINIYKNLNFFPLISHSWQQQQQQIDTEIKCASYVFFVWFLNHMCVYIIHHSLKAFCNLWAWRAGYHLTFVLVLPFALPIYILCVYKITQSLLSVCLRCPKNNQCDHNLLWPLPAWNQLTVKNPHSTFVWSAVTDGWYIKWNSYSTLKQFYVTVFFCQPEKGRCS